MRKKGIGILLLCFTLGVAAKAADTPAFAFLTDAQLLEIEKRDPSYESSKDYQKKASRHSLVTALQMASSRTGREAFQKYLNENWDKEATPTQKKEWLEKATELAKAAGKEISEFYLTNRKKSGKLWRTPMIYGQEMAGDTVTALWWEKNLFFDPKGEINFKASEFFMGGVRESTVAADPVVWADNQFKGTPKARLERDKRIREEKAAELARQAAMQEELRRYCRENPYSVRCRPHVERYQSNMGGPLDCQNNATHYPESNGNR